MEEVYSLGEDEHGQEYGLLSEDRIHIAMFGFPGTGKSTLLLHLILQNIKRNEGVVVLDPHGDLVKKLLTHLPSSVWDRVIYLDPMTAFKYGRVVQLNFLEYENILEKTLVARSFMDGLAKIYARFWGPRLDMIMMNALYALLEVGHPTLSDLYKILADEDYREAVLIRVKDPKIRSFWEEAYKKMPKEASSSVLTKIYRIIQEKILVPLFECKKSSINFRRIMDEGKIMIISLAEGALTSDLANFLGSLILAKIYIAGMSREDVPEEERKPFYVYVDEAHRFMTSSLKDMLEALRKYHVYSTLASQHLYQYREDIVESIPALCDTIISFSTGKKTARAIEEFFSPTYSYEDIMHLPKYNFAVSTLVKGVREVMVLRTIDPGIGPENPEEVIRHSLEKYARPVDVSRIIPSEEETVGVEEYPELTPAMWLVLMQFRVKGEMEKSEVISAMKQEWGASVTVTQDALHALALKNYVLVRKQVERRHKRVTTAEGKKKDVYYKNIRYYYSISPLAVRRFFSDIPVSPRAGGDEHLAMMAHLIYDLRLAGNFVFLDLGKDGEKKKPDILVFPLEKKARDKSQEINFKMWDTPHVYAIEVETKPLEYKERLLGNWRKCKNMGIPVIFAVKDYDTQLAVEEFLKSQGVNVVSNIFTSFAPGNAQVIFVQPSAVRVALPEAGEKKFKEKVEELPEALGVSPEEEMFEAFPEIPERRKEKIVKFIKEGYSFRIKKVKERKYLLAYKHEGGRSIQKSLGAFTPVVKQFLEKWGVLIEERGK